MSSEQAPNGSAPAAAPKPKLKKISYGCEWGWAVVHAPDELDSGWCPTAVFDPEMAPFRKIVFKILGGSTIITILVMWICMPLYWGSRESQRRP
jgi:hypothetical protein